MAVIFDPSKPLKTCQGSDGLNLTLCKTARRSEDRLQDHPAVHDERHEETQHGA
jgi:hypothetical protein